MTRFILCAVLALLQPALARAQTSGRHVERLDQGWEFIRSESEGIPDDRALAWKAVTIPHTWNSHDMQAGKDFYAGTGWYRRQLRLDKALANKRIFLRFEGVGQVADVFVNGQRVGGHKGAYSAFALEITRAVTFGADNIVHVGANNKERKDVIPVNHFLFGIFGGIYRPVSLIVTERINITPTDHGSPGLYIRQKDVSARSAFLGVTAKLQSDHLDRRPVTLKTTVRDRDGRIVASASSDVVVPPSTVFAATQEVRVDKPTLWHGRKNPYLYSLTTELIADGRTLDAVTQPLGLRHFRIDPDRGFILNGEPYRLSGVCRHQDRQDHGSALSDPQHQEDLDMIREIGATSIRLAHYQQADFVYSYADRVGFLVWAEIPWVNAFSAEESENAKQQLAELIRQNYNHPSIFVWGLHNEVTAESGFDRQVQLDRELHDLAKTEDPDRYDVAVSGYAALDKPMLYHADLQGINRYFGWYSGKVEDLEDWILKTRKERPGTLFALAEYGAEANVAQQSEELRFDFDPVNGQFFPENFQTYFHEVQWPMIERHPHLWASYVWNMFDFAVPLWSRGGVPARNMKGLVTYDRKTRKDAFYYYKANWSEEPVLHITSKRLRERTRESIAVTVYSNVGSVELWVNRTRLGPPKTAQGDVRQVWENVPLRPGPNEVKAVATKNGRRFEEVATWERKGAASPRPAGSEREGKNRDLARTPPMGWNSWNHFRCKGLSEGVVKAAADAMVASGMREVGYEYVVIDDCWQAPERGADGSVRAHPDRFPGGIKALADYVHARGIKLGLYAVPGSQTCAMHWDDYSGRGLGSYGHEQQDADTFAAWGVDYLKYDWCRADETEGLDRAAAFARMRDALARTGRPVVYAISEYGESKPWSWAAPIAHSWRTTHDIRANWSSLMKILDQQVGLEAYSGPGAWNDPDMLQIGNEGLSDDENRAHFSLWALLNAPLMAGNDLANMSAATRAILTNAEVIAVDQDWAGRQGRRVRGDGETEVWAKPMSDGSVAVVLLNRGDEPATIATTAMEIGLAPAPAYATRDLWTKATGRTQGTMRARVAPHAVTMLRVSRAEAR